jgi:hypothetical protein
MHATSDINTCHDASARPEVMYRILRPGPVAGQPLLSLTRSPLSRRPGRLRVKHRAPPRDPGPRTPRSAVASPPPNRPRPSRSTDSTYIGTASGRGGNAAVLSPLTPLAVPLLVKPPAAHDERSGDRYRPIREPGPGRPRPVSWLYLSTARCTWSHPWIAREAVPARERKPHTRHLDLTSWSHCANPSGYFERAGA